MTSISGSTRITGVVGAPVRHSLSPLIHNAWIAAAGLDAVYLPIAIAPTRFEGLVESLRGGSIRGLNVTLPFKARALALADRADEAASRAGAANLLLFGPEGGVEARNTDGLGLLAALAQQAPELRLDAGPAVVVGAGGAARGALSALLQAGAPQVCVVNRTVRNAAALAHRFPGQASAHGFEGFREVIADAQLIVNATSAGLNGVGLAGVELAGAGPDGAEAFDVPLEAARPATVVMDMVYQPLRTPLLRQAEALGLTLVDGLAMLIGQAIPTFEALFDAAAPAWVDVRRLALDALAQTPGDGA